MKNILLLDSNFSTDPIADNLLENGFRVIRVGKSTRKNRNDKSENFIYLDYAKTRKVFDIIKNYDVVQVIPGCTDLSFKTSLKIGETLGLVNYSRGKDLEYLGNKLALWHFLQENKIPHPKTLYNPNFETIESLKIRDWVVKPEVGFSGRDVTKINFDAIKRDYNIIARLRKKNNLIFQEFIEGPLYSFSVILKAGKIIQNYVVFEECINNNWQVNFSFIDTSFPDNTRKELTSIAERIARASSKQFGLLHLQFILSKEGPKIIEVIERMPGDLYSELIERSGNDGYVSGYLSQYLPSENFKKFPLRAKTPLARVTTNVKSLENFMRVNPNQAIQLVESYKVNRTSSHKIKIKNEVVAFFNYKNNDFLNIWKDSSSFCDLFNL